MFSLYTLRVSRWKGVDRNAKVTECPPFENDADRITLLVYVLAHLGQALLLYLRRSMDMNAQKEGHAQPMNLGERVHFLDIVRGFAMLGIIIVNYFLIVDSVKGFKMASDDVVHIYWDLAFCTSHLFGSEIYWPFMP